MQRNFKSCGGDPSREEMNKEDNKMCLQINHIFRKVSNSKVTTIG